MLSGGLCRMWEARLQQVVQLADGGLPGAGSLPCSLQHVLPQNPACTLLAVIQHRITTCRGHTRSCLSRYTAGC